MALTLWLATVVVAALIEFTLAAQIDSSTRLLPNERLHHMCSVPPDQSNYKLAE
jgi:hypothetical protein